MGPGLCPKCKGLSHNLAYSVTERRLKNMGLTPVREVKDEWHMNSLVRNGHGKITGEAFYCSICGYSDAMISSGNGMVAVFELNREQFQRLARYKVD